MAIHDSIPSMIRESLTESLVIADFCVKSRKDPVVWGSEGCFGYPGTVLLFSIADSIGSYVLGGEETKNHFKILNDGNYYNLNLSPDELEMVYKEFRCLLTHNATLSKNVGLSIGVGSLNIVERKNNQLFLNLEPFLEKTKEVVIKFLGNVDGIVNKSDRLVKILKK